jgi:hypothetical protein
MADARPPASRTQNLKNLPISTPILVRRRLNQIATEKHNDKIVFALLTNDRDSHYYNGLIRRRRAPGSSQAAAFQPGEDDSIGSFDEPSVAIFFDSTCIPKVTLH